ncbi:hypothetical protein AVEN_168461-1, partial [Araneus ventricosus]
MTSPASAKRANDIVRFPAFGVSG